MCHDKYHTRFKDLQELAKLPYFELEGDSLKISKSVGPIADVHTHLALTYIRKDSVDLHQETDTIEPYLPTDHPLDLDVYMNQNFDPVAMRKMKVDLSLRSMTRKGMRATHTAPNLMNLMADMNITHSVVLPIDLPALSWNTQEYIRVSEQYPGLVPACSIHPHRKKGKQLVRQAAAAGAKSMKMHPAVQSIKPDHPKAMELYEACGEVGMPVMWHGGPVGIVSKAADERCQMKHYWKAVHDFPNTTFIIGHAGALQVDLAIDLVRNYENAHLEISCQSLPAIQKVVDRCPPQKIMHGSDWPFYHQAVNIAKVLIATEGREELRHQFLWENAARMYDFLDDNQGHQKVDNNPRHNKEVQDAA